MSQFDQEMWQDFVVEAEDNLQELEPNLLLLEKDPANRCLLNDCFRNMHSIKGAAGYMGLQRISTLAHCMEGLFDRVRKGVSCLDGETLNAVFEGVDRLRQVVQEVAETQSESSDVADVVGRLNAAGELAAKTHVEGAVTGKAAASGTSVPSDQGATGHAGTTPAGGEGQVDAPQDSEGRELMTIYGQEMQGLWARAEAALDAEPVARGELLSVLKEMERTSHYVGLDTVLKDLAAVRGAVEGGSAADGAYANLGPEAKGVLRGTLRAALASVAGLSAGRPEDPQVGGAQWLDSEEDRELYEIFLQFVRELAAPLAQVPDEPGEDWITASQDAAQRLRASAHYMDYGEIVALLDEWQERLTENLSRMQEGVAFGADALRVLWQRLVQFLPGLDFHPADDALASGPVEAARPKGCPADALEAALDQLFDGDDLWGSQEDKARPEAAAPGREEGSLSQVPLREQGTTEVHTPQAVDPAGVRDGGSEGTRGEALMRASGGGADAGTLKEETGGAGKSVAHTVRIDLDRVEHLLSEVGDLVVVKAGLTQLSHETKSLYREWIEDRRWRGRELKPFKDIMQRMGDQTERLGRVVHRLQDTVMRMRMLPVSQLFNRYPRVVRDLAHRLNKKVDLVVVGADTGLDKRVIEQLADPLLHIVRNAVDHGIEAPDVRERRGKPVAGRLRLSASQEGNAVVLRVADDGRGLDREALIRRAISMGVLGRQETHGLSDERVWDLIFLPGISTAEMVSETSGRGVGMDVVRRNVEKLGGAIHVESTPGQGAEFVLRIPLTLAIMQALLVRVGRQIMAIPLASVQETVRIRSNEVSAVEGYEIVSLRQFALPLIRLGRIFRGTGARENPERLFVVVVRHGGGQAGLAVEGLLGQQEVVIKPLAEYLTDQPGFSGATSLGDGSIALIPDIAAVLERAKSFSRLKQQGLEKAGEGLGEADTLIH